MAAITNIISTLKNCNPLLKRIIWFEASKANLSLSVPRLVKSRRIKKKLPDELPIEVVNKRHAGIGSFQSIIDKGFNQALKPFNPPNNVSEIILRICQDLNIERIDDLTLNDPVIKFKVLVKCIKQFDHDIPNSMLHQIQSGKDLVEFYSSPVVGLVSYDQMVRDQDKLPKNLRVIAEPVRFDPETDTFFGGVSAYPNHPTVVASLRHKKKYKSHTATYKWPDV